MNDTMRTYSGTSMHIFQPAPRSYLHFLFFIESHQYSAPAGDSIPPRQPRMQQKRRKAKEELYAAERASFVSRRGRILSDIIEERALVDSRRDRHRLHRPRRSL